jgi:hypothetical protein
MIEHTGGASKYKEYTVVCDGCSNEEIYDDIEYWDELIDNMKNDDWIIRNKDGDWYHYCPACKEAPCEK